jgi:hypothetical protein
MEVQVVPIVAAADRILVALAEGLEEVPIAVVVALGEESLDVQRESLAADPSPGLEEDLAEIAVEEVVRTLAGEDRRREVVLEEGRTT